SAKVRSAMASTVASASSNATRALPSPESRSRRSPGGFEVCPDAGRLVGLVRAAPRLTGLVGGPEAGAAAAGRHRVRVVDREPGAHEGVDVVDLRALDERDA